MTQPHSDPQVLPDRATLNRWIPTLESLIRRAGDVVMAVYAEDIEVDSKADQSPVTRADRDAEAVILEGLARLGSGCPVVAEESVAAGNIPATGRCFWLVDPLDGTREFISRNGEFTVNIALIADGVPVLGLVLAPALGRLFVGGPGLGAWMDAGAGRQPIQVREVPPAGLTVVASRSHGDAAALDAFLEGRRVAQVVGAGSSLKLCLLAQGEADVYPRLGRTMEWDIAAGQAVLLGAGGQVNALTGEALAYGKPGFENPHFVAWARSPAGA
ncbi:MAG: 3'(2'),5'-bisphosphate nucleotidase CysQ [Burkholderiaceae bacterium]